MKHIADFMIEDIEFNLSNMQHELYLLTVNAYGGRMEIANKVKDTKNLKVKFFTCGDDCAGAYRKTKVIIYTDD